MRRLYTALLALILLGALVGCGGAAPAAESAPTASVAEGALLTVDEALTRGADAERVVVVGVLLAYPDALRLTSGVELGAQSVAPRAGAQTLLVQGTPPSGLELSRGGIAYGAARVVGRLVQGEGGLTLEASDIKPLQPISVALGDLGASPAIYQGQIIVLEGTLIVSEGEALLVDSVGPGGVPDANAAQIKIQTPLSSQLLATLTPQGALQIGPARLLGLWRGKELIALWSETP